MAHIKIHKLYRTKRKTLSLIVNPDGQLIVRAPLKLPIEEIKSFVIKKQKWIFKKQKQAANKVVAPEKEFKEGERFLFLGKQYPLSIKTDLKYALGFYDDTFLLNSKYIQYSKNLFVQWYKMQAHRIFWERAQFFSGKTGLKFNNIKISNAMKRWGSCSSGKNLNFSWRLVLAPQEVIDYIIVHEIAHLKEMNHSAKFHRLVEQIMPDYRIHKDWIVQNGHLLEV